LSGFVSIFIMDTGDYDQASLYSPSSLESRLPISGPLRLLGQE